MVDGVNKYPDMMDLRVEKFKLIKYNWEDTDTYYKKIKMYGICGNKVLKVSKSNRYIFTTEKALKLMLHINTFKNFEFNIENKYCENTYKLFSIAITEFESVREVFCFSAQNEIELKIECLSTGAMFPADFEEIDSIREYMKYHIIDSKQYRKYGLPIKTPNYKPLSNLLLKYSKYDVLEALMQNNIYVNKEILEKCSEVYCLFNERCIRNKSNDTKSLDIKVFYDEFGSNPDRIVIYNDNKQVNLSELNLDDWLNVNTNTFNISSRSEKLWLLALSILTFVMIKYYNEKPTNKNARGYCDLNEMACENLINILDF